MKKTYSKPFLYAESYALVEHISQSCGMVTNFGNTCPVGDGGLVFFQSLDMGCNEDGISAIEFAGYDPKTISMEDLIQKINPTCYNSFSEYAQMYTSM